MIITKKWLDTKPRSIAKDFYIWRYLDQNITPDEAIDILGEVKNVNKKILKRYAKKLKHKETSKVIQCINMNPQDLIKENSSCIENGMTIYKATKLSHKQLDIIISKIKNIYPNSAKRFEILNSKKPFEMLLKSSTKDFFAIFNNCGSNFRAKYFNHILPLNVINKLKLNKEFTQTIKLIVTNKKLTKLQQSLLNINPKGLTHEATFFLAINAIKYNKTNIALKYLNISYKNAYFQDDKDKTLFWQYKLTNNKKYLKLLSQSLETNLYSLLAFEQLNIKPKNANYSMPYKNIINKLPTKRQALIYAIARQESRFNAKAISPAYALGIMQIMPFLSKAIAKELNEFYDIDKQFEPKTNIKYGNYHISFLEKKLKSPLFIAYGYNAGIGFVKKIFKSNLFNYGTYEPFLSIETLPYSETRKYGKKVLRNYIIYYNKLHPKNKITLNNILNKTIKFDINL
jgi:soluble lytic murein transglycosylase